MKTSCPISSPRWPTWPAALVLCGVSSVGAQPVAERPQLRATAGPETPRLQLSLHGGERAQPLRVRLATRPAASPVARAFRVKLVDKSEDFRDGSPWSGFPEAMWTDEPVRGARADVARSALASAAGAGLVEWLRPGARALRDRVPEPPRGRRAGFEFRHGPMWSYRSWGAAGRLRFSVPLSGEGLRATWTRPLARPGRVAPPEVGVGIRVDPFEEEVRIRFAWKLGN